MPTTKYKIRRMCLVYQIIKDNNYPSKEDIIWKLENITNEEYCPASIEKDMFNLKMDFDTEIKYCKKNKGYYIVEPDDKHFLFCLFELLKVSDLPIIQEFLSADDMPY